MFRPDWELARRDELAETIPLIAVTDARSLHDHLVKDASSSKDRRLRLEVNIIKSIPRLQIRWVRSEMMTADHLTKEVGPEISNYARVVRDAGLWTLGLDPRAPASTRQRPLEPPVVHGEQERNLPDLEGFIYEAEQVEYELPRRRVHRGRRPRQGGA